MIIMKIVYCINGTYNSGGMEKMLMNKANYCADVLGYEIIIVTTEQKGRTHFFAFSPKIKFVDLNINYDEDKNLNILVRLLLKEKKKRLHRRRLTRLLYEVSPDICISMFDRDMSFLWKIEDGSKKILEYHFSKNAKVLGASSALVRFLQKIRIFFWIDIIRNYDRFVVLTEEDKVAWGNLPNCCVIPNFLTELPDKTSTLSHKRVISVGRLSYEKGFDLLINAWYIVHRMCPDWQLFIWGNGEQHKELSEQLDKLHLLDSVYLMPATSQIGNEYLNSSIYAMSSRYEGFGMVLLEAMSYGLPIVSFSCPCGPVDLVSTSVGSLVPVGDIKQLAQKLILLMEDQNLRKELGDNARKEIRRYLQSEIMIKWDYLFRSLLNENL